MKFFALLIASVAAVQISKNDWVNTKKQKYSDVGDQLGAAEAQHKAVMDQANIWEAKRSGDVAAQAKSDVWRGQGDKVAWAPRANFN